MSSLGGPSQIIAYGLGAETERYPISLDLDDNDEADDEADIPLRISFSLKDVYQHLYEKLDVVPHRAANETLILRDVMRALRDTT